MGKYDQVRECAFEPKWRDDAKRAYECIESMGARLMRIKSCEVDALMQGAIDMHVHAAPDPLIDTGWDELDVALRATDAGMGGVVFKSHSMPTAAVVYELQQVVDRYALEKGIEPAKLYGGVVLNYYAGGLNPRMVEACARLGGKMCWLPSHDSRHHNLVIGEDEGIDLLTPEGEIVEDLRRVMQVCAEYNLILDPCHCGTKERFVIIEEAKKMGIDNIILTHPDWNVTRCTIEQQAEMGRMGAYVGLFMYGAVPFFNNPNCDPWEMFEIIRAVGPDRVVAATDLGTMLNVHPVEGMRLFIRIMLAGGVSKEDISKMIKGNPRKLLGLDK